MEDVLVLLFCYCIFGKGRRAGILLLPAVLFLAVFDFTYQGKADRMLDGTFYEAVTEKQIGEQIAQVGKEEEGFYRMEQWGGDQENEGNMNRVWDMGQYISSVYSSTYHEGYADFRDHVFGVEKPFRNFLMQPASKNPIFQCFMGVKYVVSKEPVPGYEVYADNGKQKVYVNPKALPVAYATDKVISEEEYKKLKFPYNQLAFLEYAVAGRKPSGDVADGWDMEKHMQELFQMKDVEVELPGKKNGQNSYSICTKQKIRTKISLPKAAGRGEILFLRFRVKNRKSRDIEIRVNGVCNKLSARSHLYYNKNERFTYAILPEEGAFALDAEFGEGDYEIFDVECLLGKVKESGQELCQSEFMPDWGKTKGNRIAGAIKVLKDGYFITSIPYDKGFEVRVDGKTISYTKVNMAFLGFPMEKGEHMVELIYHAPGAAAGKIVSLIGILLFLLMAGIA